MCTLRVGSIFFVIIFTFRCELSPCTVYRSHSCSSREIAQEAVEKGLPAHYRGLSDTQHQPVRAPWADGMSATENTTQEAPAAPAAEGSRPAVTADDNLACQWDKCSDRCASAEALFVSLPSHGTLTFSALSVQC